MIRRTLMLCAVLLAAVCLGAGAAAPSRASSPNAQMRGALMAIRGLIDREGATRYFAYPARSNVRAGRLSSSWWPTDPWTGARMTAGSGRGHYRYAVSADRRHYSLVGYLDGGAVTLAGGMPKTIMLAYDHRGEEGIHLIRQYLEDYTAAHGGVYPLAAQVNGDGAVGNEPEHRYWPSNPWDHDDMAQRADRGSFSYAVAADRMSYTLRLHRALSVDYVLKGTTLTSPWQQLLSSLQDEILRRSGKVLAGYVGQWALQHAGTLPTADELSPSSAVGAAHSDWPQDPAGGLAMQPGTGIGAYSYSPGAGGAFTLTVHLHSGDFPAGGVAPSPTAPARGSGPSEP